MNAINYSTARQNLSKLMARVCDDREPIVVTRHGEGAVVMLSLEEYKSMEETAHLMRSPANAKRLVDAIKSLKAGKGKTRKLAE
jgi:antitoxin YefM